MLFRRKKPSPAPLSNGGPNSGEVAIKPKTVPKNPDSANSSDADRAPSESPEVIKKKPAEPRPFDFMGEDALLKELEEKLAAKEGKGAETPTQAPATEPAAPIEAQLVAGEEAAEVAPLVPETKPDEELKSLESDATLTELQEKVADMEKIEAPKVFGEYCTFELPAGYQEVERYWIAKPYAWVAILYNPELNERLYQLVEPSLTPAEKTALELIHGRLLDRLVYDARVKDRDRVIAEKTMKLLTEYGVELSEKSIKKLLYYLKRNFIGYGKIDCLLRDPNTEDISCDGTNVPIFLYHRKHQSIKTTLIFKDAEELDLFVIRLVERAGKQISLGKPTVDASLPEGYRLQTTLGTEVTTRGSSFSIRKYAEEPFTPIDLILFGTFSADMLAYLWLATENKKNILIAGGTASGKCVTGKTKILLANSRLEDIKNIAERAFEHGNVIRTEDGWLTTDADFKVFSMYPDLKTRPTKVSKVWKRAAPPYLYRVKTRTGKEITTTPEHPFFVLERGLVKKRIASELKSGMFIATPRRIQYEGKSTDLSDAVNGLRRLNISMDEERTHFVVKSPKGRPLRIPKQITPELLEFVGYVLADGHVRESERQVLFHNADPVLLNRFCELARSIFSASVKIRKPRGRTTYAEIGSRALCIFLRGAFGIPLGKKAKKVDISHILGATLEECRAFLRALFDCESHVHIQKGTIELTSASRALVKQVEILLNRFGIVSITNVKAVKGHQYWRLLVGGGAENLGTFRREVGYLHPIKKKKLESAIKSHHSTNFDVIDISDLISTLKGRMGLFDREIAEGAGLKRRAIGRYREGSRNITRPSLQRLVCSLEEKYKKLAEQGKRDHVVETAIKNLALLSTSDVLWDEITDIVVVRPEEPWVYDLTVDPTHNFVANGVVAHNTCSLNAFSMFIWPDAKIVSLEDTRELSLYQENWLPSVTRPAPGERAIDMYELLRTALRQRPEVIIVGEVRGKEALTMFQAMVTGHTVYSTMHAGSMQEVVHRLEGEPINVPHHMLASLDIICLQLLTYFRDQRVRRNQSVVEVAGIDPASGALRTNRIFERNPLTDEFEKVGESLVLREIAQERGWSALQLEKELRNRRAVLEYLANNNIKRMAEVAAIIRQYHFDPEGVMKQISARV